MVCGRVGVSKSRWWIGMVPDSPTRGMVWMVTFTVSDVSKSRWWIGMMTDSPTRGMVWMVTLNKTVDHQSTK
jgi:hypothetical protein